MWPDLGQLTPGMLPTYSRSLNIDPSPNYHGSSKDTPEKILSYSEGTITSDSMLIRGRVMTFKLLNIHIHLTEAIHDSYVQPCCIIRGHNPMYACISLVNYSIVLYART